MYRNITQNNNNSVIFFIEDIYCRTREKKITRDLICCDAHYT